MTDTYSSDGIASASQPQPTSLDIIEGGGEMGALIRSIDWSKTPLGAVESWSPSLKNLVCLILASQSPFLLWVGSELTQIYNDGCRPILGANKHPAAMGGSARGSWAESWDVIGAMAESVYSGGVATYSSEQLLFMDRNGYMEEAYFTFGYSPIFEENGTIGGVLVAVNEVTPQVLSRRRLNLLHRLSERASSGKTVGEACRIAADILAENAADIPFMMIYLIDPDGHQAHYTASSGIDGDTTFSPSVIDLISTDAAGWALDEAFITGQIVVVDDLAARFTSVPAGLYADTPPHTAIILPIRNASGITGFLIGGISPRLALDDEYRSFYELIAGHIASVLSNTRAYEDAHIRADKLAALDRAKTEFFSNVSHELRTPLTLMINPLQEVIERAGGDLPADQRENLEVSYRNVLRMQKLVNNLLDFSRIQANRMQALYQPTDLASLTADLASTFRSAVERAGMVLSVDAPQLDAPVYIDVDMYEKIVLNLLSNAFKHTFEGGITVALHRVDDHVALRVTDTGVGIPASELPRLFEHFLRVGGAKSRTFEGTGIGLSLTQELVHLHGGTITVESQPGVGSTFTVAIPFGTAHLPPNQIDAPRPPPTNRVSGVVQTMLYVQEAMSWLDADNVKAITQSAELPAVPDSAALSNTRVLVVDDNADMRAYLVRLLETRFRVETAANVSAALAKIAHNPPNLVLSDIMLPEGDGFDLLRTVRANPATASLPIILLSARAEEEARIKGIQAGADDYLIKPFSAREVLSRVEAQLQLAQMRDVIQEVAKVSKDTIQNIIDGITDPFYAVDPGWRFIYANQAAERLWNKRSDELIGKTVQDIFPLWYSTAGFAELQRAKDEGSPRQFESYSPTFEQWYEVSAYPSTLGLGVYFRNIDDRKSAEERARRLHEITAALAKAITAHDVAETMVTQAFTAMGASYGYVALLRSDDRLQLLNETSVPPSITEWLRDVTLDTPTGMSDAIRTRTPVWVESLDEYRRLYPEVMDALYAHTQTQAFAFVPLFNQDRVIGGMGLAYTHAHPFEPAERDYITTLAQQVAQALDRARLYEEERSALHRAEALQQLTAAFSRAVSMSQVTIVITHALAILNANIATLYMLNEDENTLKLISYEGLPAELVQKFDGMPITTPVATADAVRTRTAIWLHDYQEYAERYPLVAGDGKGVGVQALVALPLFHEDVVTGSLSLVFAQPQTFDRNMRAYLLAVAEQCAQALERARLYEREQTALRRAESLQRVTATFSALVALDDMAQIIVQEMESLGVTWSVTHLVTPRDSTVLQLTSHFGIPVDVIEQYRQMSIDLPLPTSEVALKQEPIWLEDFQAFVTRYPGTFTDASASTVAGFAALPLFRSERFIGVISFNFVQPQRFDHWFRLYLLSVGEQVAQAVERTRLYEQEQVALRRAESLQRLTAAFSNAITVQQVANAVRQGVGELGVNSSTLHLLSEDGTQLHLIPPEGMPTWVIERYGAIPLDTPLPIGDTVRTRRALWLHTLTEYAALYPLAAPEAEANNVQALASLPLLDQNEVVGALSLIYDQPQPFDRNLIAYLLAISEQCAQALERARLYEQEKITFKRAEALQQLTAAFSRAVTVGDVAGVITSGLADLDASSGTIFLMNPDRQSLGLISEHGIPKERVAQFSTLPLDTQVVGTDVVKTGQAWMSNFDDFAARYPTSAPSSIAMGMQSIAVLPLSYQDNVIGVLTLIFMQSQTFDRNLRAYLFSAAEQCAQAIERARLYEAQVEARRLAEEANTLKMKFLAMVSHELRTPLASIKGFSSTLLADDVTFTMDQQLRFIRIMDDETDKLTDLVEQLLDLSRLQAGTLRIEPVQQAFEMPLKTALVQIETLAQKHPVALEIAPDLPLVNVDKQRIAQVLVNLVGNAVKFSAVGSTITIKAAAHDGILQVDISDQGIGVPVEDRELIFEAFRQVERKNLNQGKGAGLGLAICKGIIEAHGGRIWIQADHEQITPIGTTISFTLPMASAPILLK